MYNLLMVDDEKAILNGLELIIPWSNYEIDICCKASSGEEALAFLKDNEVDIMLVDIKMPGISGIELITEALKLNSGIKSIVLSGYNEYPLIRASMRAGSVDYLLKPVSALELDEAITTVLKQIEKVGGKAGHYESTEDVLFQNTMRRIVHGHFSTKDIRERLTYFKMDIYGDLLQIMLFHASSGMEHITLSNITQLFSKYISGRFRIFFDDTGDLCLIMFAEEGNSDPAEIHSAIMLCAKALGSYCAATVKVVAGEPVEGWNHFAKEYANVKRQLGFALMNTTQSSAVAVQSDNKLYINQTDSAALKRFLLNIDGENASRFIANIFFISGIYVLNESARGLSANIIDIISETALEAHVSVLSVNDARATVNESMETSASLSLLIYAIQQYMLGMIAHNKNQKCLHASALIKRAIQITEETFCDQNLCLKTLAQEVGVNPSYLGRRFKSETQESFSDYLNRIRIHYAESLLNSKYLKINEVAQQAGFSSTSYFIAIFKKITTKTPGEIRMLL